MHKLIILTILILCAIAAFGAHAAIKKNIDPKRSGGYFILYIVLHLASVFLIVFTASFLIFKYGSLLYKK